jgi:K+-sensing histidine kinase KdpD
VLAALQPLTFNYFFIQPYFTLMVHQTQDFLGLVVLGVAVVLSQLLGRTRRSLSEATAREQEAIRLYERARYYPASTTRKRSPNPGGANHRAFLPAR